MRVKIKIFAVFMVVTLTFLLGLILILPETSTYFLEQYLWFSFYDPLLVYVFLTSLILVIIILVTMNLRYIYKNLLKHKGVLSFRRKCLVVSLFVLSVYLLVSSFGYFNHNTVINIEERVACFKMDSPVWWNYYNIDTKLEDAKELGITTVVVGAGGTATYYPSKIVQYRVNEQAHHYFGYIIHKAKEHGFSVYALMDLGWDYTDNYKTITDTTPYSEYWAVNREGIPWANAEGERGRNWLSPVYPQVKELYYNIAEELLEEYAIDGIILDFVRYLDHPTYDLFARSKFIKAHNKDPIDLDYSMLAWYRYEAFLVDQINEIVMGISSTCKKYNALLGTACFTAEDRDNLVSGTDAWFIGQDWVYWCEMGYVDMIYSMGTYTVDVDQYIKNLQYSKVVAGDTPILFGILGNPDNFASRVNTIRSVGGAGFFLWDFEKNIFDPNFKERFNDTDINAIFELSMRDFVSRTLKKFAILIAFVVAELSILIMILSEKNAYELNLPA